MLDNDFQVSGVPPLLLEFLKREMAEDYRHSPLPEPLIMEKRLETAVKIKKPLGVFGLLLVRSVAVDGGLGEI